MKNQLTVQEKKDMRRLFFRSWLINGSMQAIKRQGQGFCYTLLPFIDRVYANDDKARKEALVRNNQFFNSHASTSAFLVGLTYALEKSKAEGEDITGETITNIKTSLMGPLAGIGDSLFLITLRVIGAGVGISFAKQGSALGALAFLLIYGLPFMAIKYPLIVSGYTIGTRYLNQLFEKGLINSINKAASIMGLMMTGTLVASLVKIQTGLKLTAGGATVKLQDTLDTIMPSMLSLIALFIVYKMVKRKIPIMAIIFIVIGFGILMSAIGILA